MCQLFRHAGQAGAGSGGICEAGYSQQGALTEENTMADLPNQMLSSADEALYSAKHKGKNAVGIATLSDLS